MAIVFIDQIAKARKDPLGSAFLSAMKGNMAWVRSLAQLEHAVTGEHNVRRVPRVCQSIVWGGSSYSVSPGSSDIPSVGSAATGTVTLTLASGRFGADIRPQINFKGSGVSTKPWSIGYTVDSPTSVTVFLKELTDALGAGNTFAAANGSFDIALHSDPLPLGLWSPSQKNHLRGDTLGDGADDWNALVQSHGDMFAALTAGHDSAGAHNVREVAKSWAHVTYSPTAYSIASGSSNVSGVSRTSAGVCVVTHSSMTTPTQCFVSPDYQRTAGGQPVFVIAQAEQTSATQTTVYIFKSGISINVHGDPFFEWTLADSDFFVAVHGG